MPEEEKTIRINISLLEKTKKLLEDLSENAGQSRSAVVRVALQLLYFIMTKVCEGYEVQLVNKKTKEVIVLPIHK